eukprot:gene656-8157_t
MNKYSWLLILLSALAFVNLSVCVPIRCGTVSVNALDYEPSLEEEKTILDAFDLDLNTVDCGGKDVCTHECKCGKRIFYHDILSIATNEKDRRILGKAYLKACIRRKWQNDDGGTNGLLAKLMELLKEKVDKDEIEKVNLKKDDWGKIREGIMDGGKKNYPWQFLVIAAELLFTYKKNCVKKGEWRNHIDHDIEDIINYGTDKIKKRFKQNEFLRDYFLYKINKLKDIKKKMEDYSKDSKKKKVFQKFTYIFNEYKRYFEKQIIKKEYSQTYCKCKHLNKYGDAKKIFDKLKLEKMVSKACDIECASPEVIKKSSRKNSLSTAREEDF